jgi:hypothetical protein
VASPAQHDSVSAKQHALGCAAQEDLESAEQHDEAATVAEQALRGEGAFSESAAIENPTTATANARAKPIKTRFLIQNLRSENRLGTSHFLQIPLMDA